MLLPLERADPLEPAGEGLAVARALAEELQEPGFLDLLLEPLLEAVVGFIAFLVGVDSHAGAG